MQKNRSIYFRRFGFELELSTPLDTVKPIIKKLVEKYVGKGKFAMDQLFNSKNTNKSFKKWELKYDGSTESEITTPISTMKDFPTITKIVNGIKNAECKVTHKDSVHVHMQAEDVHKHNIISAWLQIEKPLLNCFPKHRRNNMYCQKLQKHKSKQISNFFINAEKESFSHHSIVSLQFYDDRKTVEFRAMEGNMDSNDIKQWVKFCMLFLNYAKKVDPVEIICGKDKHLKLDDMIQLLKIEDKEVIEFLIRREKLFKK